MGCNPNGITAIVGVGPRWRNVPIIVKRLRNQTIPPETIIVWHDHHEEAHDLRIPGVICINSTYNRWQSYPQFVMGFFARTEYLAIVDDDKPPGPKWFEHVLGWIKRHPGVYGCFGYRIYDPNRLYSGGHVDVYSRLGDGKPRMVDHVGQSWFLKSEWIRYYFREQPPAWGSTEDLHLAHMLSKYGNINFYVAFPREEEALPVYNPKDLVHGELNLAVHRRPYHRGNRKEYVKWAVQRGWKLKNWKSDNR